MYRFRRSALQVMASLYILGRGTCFDTVTELSFIGEQTEGQIFHKFCHKFAVHMYDKWIKTPVREDLATVMRQFAYVGFPGAVGSTDVTHVAWGCTPQSHARSYCGNEGFPTIAFEATVDHMGRVLGVTKGFAGAQNDKTIVRFDRCVQRVREAEPYKSVRYKLRRTDGTQSEEVGAYLIVNGGYHKVRRTQAISRFDLYMHVAFVPATSCQA